MSAGGATYKLGERMSLEFGLLWWVSMTIVPLNHTEF
jgi:hypothetical protein